MTICFEVPKEIEEQVRSTGTDPARAAKELFLVELYRQRQVTHHQLSEALGLNRIEVDGVLKRHDVPLDITLEQFKVEAASLRELRRG